MSLSENLLPPLRQELPRLGNPEKAAGAQKYMKNIAPFLGVQTPERRALVRRLCADMQTPSASELAQAVRTLWSWEQREYHYVAYDLLSHFNDSLDDRFLEGHVAFLIVNKSWWDTVDGLGTAAVSPVTVRYPSVPLMRQWLTSSNIWLNRAAIQHQRGRKSDTDIDLLIEFCDYHSDSREFYITKAIGWALRDLSRIDNTAVETFLKEHPDLHKVAVREAVKLSRVT
jgi:3-methyladenine DNA glycosylase AlkD